MVDAIRRTLAKFKPSTIIDADIKRFMLTYPDKQFLKYCIDQVNLTDEEKTILSLCCIHTQEEVADLLFMSKRTLQRRYSCIIGKISSVWNSKPWIINNM